MTYLHSLWALALAHPELWPLVLWPVLTALVSFWHADVEPRFPRLVLFLKATGVDLPKLWALLRGIEPKVPPLPPALGVLLVALAFWALGIAAAGCSGAPPISSDVIAGEDIGDATCAILEGIPQTDTATVQFICSQIPKPGSSSPPKTFRVKVNSADAAKFAEAHCVQAGSGAPTP